MQNDPVAAIGEGGAGLSGFAKFDHCRAFAHLKPTDNIIQFSSARYSGNPLIVQGPGAGPEVTAAGVFADLLRVAQGLGTRL